MAIRRKPHRHIINKSTLRRGTALVEFAICLPLLTVLLLGTIEASSMIFLKQSLTIAAYEGARTALRPGATAAGVIADCTQITTDRGLHDVTVTLTPDNLTNLPAGDFITVQVSAPCESNSLFATWFYKSQVLSAEFEVMKEF